MIYDVMNGSSNYLSMEKQFFFNHIYFLSNTFIFLPGEVVVLERDDGSSLQMTASQISVPESVHPSYFALTEGLTLMMLIKIIMVLVCR